VEHRVNTQCGWEFQPIGELPHAVRDFEWPQIGREQLFGACVSQTKIFGAEEYRITNCKLSFSATFVSIELLALLRSVHQGLGAFA
jgi:hypothetical protein